MRDPMATGLAALTRLAGWRVLDRWGLRDRVHRAVFLATRAGYRTGGAVGRTVRAAGRSTGSRAGRRPPTPAGGKPARAGGAPVRLPAVEGADLIDLTPTEDQRLMCRTVAEFAAERLRPAAAGADTEARASAGVLAAAAALGLASISVPEELGGAATERSQMTGVLVAEQLAHGDLGLAVACLAPGAVGTAVSLWGDAEQQATYLPAFVGDRVTAAALAIMEPRPLFDPFELRTTATRSGGGFVLDGVKSLVPLAATAEVLVVAAELDGGPALFLVEGDGPTTEAEPAMGLRAAGTGRIRLDRVRVPAGALLGGADPRVYAECVHLARLAWCALAVGTAQAVLDYVIPYVNQRHAFGEPISHRQAVAFTVADLGIETDGMRLVTYRAASRAARGLPFAREVTLARRLCAERGMRIGSDGVQLLGGHGYVKDHPVQRWYRDLRATGLMEGGLLT